MPGRLRPLIERARSASAALARRSGKSGRAVRAALEALALHGPRRARELVEWLAVASFCAGLWLSADLRARVFVCTVLALRASAPVWAALAPHDPPGWLNWLARSFAWTRLPLFTSLLDHDAHHLRPRVPTYSLSRVLRPCAGDSRRDPDRSFRGQAICLAVSGLGAGAGSAPGQSSAGRPRRARV